MGDAIRKTEMDEKALDSVSGGVDGMVGLYDGPTKRVTGLKSGYLALRSEPRYDARNEIGCLYNGDKVKVIGNDAMADHDFNGPGLTFYTWVFAEKLGKSGWVNSSFIK
ncbi:MAG: hypothetical protein Q4D81_10035 [Eubacteriales bacterium]|nr:hypothetical protein [Eubacteriales bacterium]